MNGKYRRILNTSLLCANNKACVILVAEGTKPFGSIANYSFEEIDCYDSEKRSVLTRTENLIRELHLFPFRISYFRRNGVMGEKTIKGYMSMNVAREEDSISKFRTSRSNPKALGEFYGYPSCCIEAFSTRNPSSLPKLNKKDAFVFHRVCSTECSASMQLSEAYKETLEQVAPGLVQKAIEED